MHTLTKFFKTQLDCWPLAANNYAGLDNVEERTLTCGGFPVKIQFNPTRIRSTAANIDAAAIARRKCFLCRENRPDEQMSLETPHGFEILVNPYPIFCQHFTIASTTHRHQDQADFSVMAQMATDNRGYLFFFNGSKSGASAPDHLHFQACRATEIPLVGILTDNPGALMKSDNGFKCYFPDSLPMFCLHIVSTTFDHRTALWLDNLLPHIPLSGTPDKGMRNVMMWVDIDKSLHTLLFPRKSHRPSCYFAQGKQQILVSPGAVDMAGIIIVPRREDFDKLTAGDIMRIYDETSLDFRSEPVLTDLMLACDE